MSADAVIESFLNDRGITYAKTGDQIWSLALAGEQKKSLGAAIALTASGLKLEAFFMRAPVENRDRVYRLFLSRNARARLVWFAADTQGDVYLLGYVPAAAVTMELLDALLGELLSTADQMFTAAVELGFADYLAKDMAWRAKNQS